MALHWRWLVLAGALLTSPLLHAQIYTCRAADGSRVFSNEKCGDDATVVKGFESTKQKPPVKGKAASGSDLQRLLTPPGTVKAAPTQKEPKPAPKSTPELAALLKQCNAGDMKACKEWTLGGGPNSLREAEHKAEMECEAGSLSDCEERYCKSGATEDCRQRVLRSAKLSGETWYLRDEGARHDDGSTTFDVRCIHKGNTTTRDIAITCVAKTGKRCYAQKPPPTFERLDQTATNYCGSK
jgi:hypothetical protein